jgi:hypothetical protein
MHASRALCNRCLWRACMGQVPYQDLSCTVISIVLCNKTCLEVCHSWEKSRLRNYAIQPGRKRKSSVAFGYVDLGCQSSPVLLIKMSVQLRTVTGGKEMSWPTAGEKVGKDDGLEDRECWTSFQTYWILRWNSEYSWKGSMADQVAWWPICTILHAQCTWWPMHIPNFLLWLRIWIWKRYKQCFPRYPGTST